MSRNDGVINTHSFQNIIMPAYQELYTLARNKAILLNQEQ